MNARAGFVTAAVGALLLLGAGCGSKGASAPKNSEADIRNAMRNTPKSINDVPADKRYLFQGAQPGTAAAAQQAPPATK